MASIPFESEATKDLVSIITPTYRKERFIGETLASIARQTFTNWELIVVEDGSHGGAEQIVREFAKEHAEHRVVYRCNDRNYGAAYTRNVAFAKARGEFVALLDSDDRWLPDHLDVSVQALKSTGKDIVFSTVRMFEDQTDLVLGSWGPDKGDMINFPYSMFRRSFVTPSATVLQRRVLETVGTWDNRFLYCEDADYWMRCVAAGMRFHHIPGYHCLYRKNHAGATTQKLCGTLEEFAEIALQYANNPNLDARKCRKFASKAFLVASRLHSEADPEMDASTDRSRVAPLLLRAWRLRPKHVDYLIKGSVLTVANRFRRKHRPTAAAVSRNVEPATLTAA